MNNNGLTIYVVDDDPEVCKALRWLFESVNLPVETYESAKKFLAAYNTNFKGCLILDVRMPIMSGLELLDKLNELNHQLPTLVITGHGDIPMAVRAMKAGAMDFILKPINDQVLLETIHKCISRPAEEKHKPISPPKTNILTQREQQVMEMIINGKFNKMIAHELNISISTVEAHRSRIMNKFQAKNLAQLIKKYYQIT